MSGTKNEIAPSILAADFSRLAEQVRSVEPHAGRIHVDVMDGHFVPNLSMGPAVVRSLRPHVSKPIEVHLMVEEPERFFVPFVDAGADRIIFHVEAAGERSADLCRDLSKLGVKAGLALRPVTVFEKAEPLLELIDLVIVMTVEPGFGGQEFIEDMLVKVRTGRRLITEKKAIADIEVDGGIDPKTGALCAEAGANVFVAGTSIFGAPDPSRAALDLARAVGAES